MSVLPPPPGDGDDGQARPESHPVHHVPPGGPDLPPLPLGIVVPDDLSALDEEIASVRRELRRERRIARLQAVPILRRVPARGLSGTIVILSLFAVALLGTMLMAFPPGRNSPQPTARPLASPTEKVGTAGGLVPMIDLMDATGRETPVRTLRPAVLAYIRAGCACADELRAVAAQSHEFGLTTYFIERGAVPSGGVPLAQLSQQTSLTGFLDLQAQLTDQAPAAGEATLLFVAPDGRLAVAPFAYTLGQRLEPMLADVVR